MPPPDIKNKNITTDVFCMPFRGFLEAIKTQAETAPEEIADDEEVKPADTGADASAAPAALTFDMEFKMKIPIYCT